MWRALLEPVVFFVAPFVAYALYLMLRLRYPFAFAAWGRTTVSILSLIGLAAAALAILGFGLFAPRHLGTYVPAHQEDGRLVPGHYE